LSKMKNNEAIERICIDCGRKFLIYPDAQNFFKSRGLDLPKRCRACREQRKQAKKAEEAAKKFEAELETSKYTVIKISDIEVSSPATTLYVMGNGFDLAHGVPSSYSKFRDWIGRRSNLRKTLETYIRNDALWWNLEEALADLDLDMPSMAIPEMLDAFGAYDSDAQMADYYAAIDMAMLPVDTITNELPKKFRKWVESLRVDSSVKPLRNVVKPGAKYLNFNYTEFAETLYGAKNVCYIHGSRKNRKAKLILGHSYKKYVPDVSVKMPRFKDGFKRTMVNVAFDDAMVHAGWYDQVTTKNSRQIIKDNKSFFDALSDIDTIIVIGHSLSEVDMEYFEKIRSVAHSDAKWIFSCHDSGGLKAVDAFAKMMGISADKVTVFRL
jgi:hypothetical protein